MTNFEYERKISELQKKVTFYKGTTKALTECLTELLEAIFEGEDVPSTDNLNGGIDTAKRIIRRDKEKGKKKENSSSSEPISDEAYHLLARLCKMDLPRNSSPSFSQAVSDFMSFLNSEDELNFSKFEFLRNRLFAELRCEVDLGRAPELLHKAAICAFNDIDSPQALEEQLSNYRRRKKILEGLQEIFND